MPFFESVPDVEVKNQEQEMLNNAYDPARDSAPGFFEGAPEAVSKGYKTASLNLINLGATAAHKAGFIDDENIKTFDEAFIDVKKQLSPDPQVTGFLGQIVHPITTMLSEAIPATLLGGPLVGAAITAGAEGVAHTKVLESEGVDPETAAKVGTVTGISAGLGLLLPAAIPGKIATRIASGLGINIAAGGAQRGVTGKTLRDNGYSEMADQYRVLDGISMLVDGVLGSAFGALHSAKSTLPSLKDAALSANNIHQLEIDSAPGIPADIATRNSHVAAMEQSTLQLLDNEPVNIATKFDEPNFIAKKINPEIHAGFEDALKEGGFAKLFENINRYDALADLAEVPEQVGSTPFKDIKDIDVKEEPEIQWRLEEYSALSSKKEALADWLHTDDEVRIKNQPEVDAIKETINPDQSPYMQEIAGLKNKLERAKTRAKGAEFKKQIDTLTAKHHKWFQGELAKRVQEEYQATDYKLRDAASYISTIKGALDEYNQGMQNIADKYGIETNNITENQFWDKVSERLSEEESFRENNAHSEAAMQAFKDAEEMAAKTAELHIESKDDVWDYSPTELRTLEDLENEWQQERSAEDASENDFGSKLLQFFRQKKEVVNNLLQSKEGLGKSQLIATNKETISSGPKRSEGNSESTRRAGEEGAEIDGAVINAKTIATEKPYLQIVDDQGDVISAAEAIKASEENMTRVEKEKGLFDVAVNCFIRNG